MEERIRPTRSGLFTIELMIAVGIFALCAAICVGLFVRAEVTSRNSSDLGHAVAEARSVCECFKAASGDMDQTAALTGGTLTGDGLSIYYDSDWNPVSGGDAATYSLRLELTPEQQVGIVSATVTVDIDEAQLAAMESPTILSWQVSAWEVAS